MAVNRENPGGNVNELTTSVENGIVKSLGTATKTVESTNWLIDGSDAQTAGGSLDMNRQPLTSPKNPTNSTGVGDRNYNDGRYITDVSTVEPSHSVDGELWIDLNSTGTTNNTKTIKILTTDYTVLSSDYVLVFDITSNSLCTLPDPTGNVGAVYDILCKYSATANVTFSENIDGDSSYTLTPGEVVNIISDGTEYIRNA